MKQIYIKFKVLMWIATQISFPQVAIKKHWFAEQII